MRGAFQLAKIFGIPVRIHWTFGLIILWIVYLVAQQNLIEWGVVLWITLFVLTLFACVVLHEFGHALTARRFGVKTLDIILSPIGGVARLDRMPEKPIQEFWVAIAGPLVNFGIIILLLIFYYFYSSPEQFALLLKMPRQILYPQSNIFPILFDNYDRFIIGIMAINGILAAFNLLPAFPLDGGRIFRSLLSIKIGRLKATRIAAYLGQIFAILLVIYAFYRFDFILGIIGFFVFSNAENEYRSVKLEEILKQRSVRDLLLNDFIFFYSNSPISEAYAQMKEKSETQFLVLDSSNNELIGKINIRSIEKKLEKSSNPEELSLKDVPIYPISIKLAPDETLKEAYFKLRRSNENTLPVQENGIFIGMLSVHQIEQFIVESQK